MDTITIYLAGEIHSDWRERIREELTKRDLPVRFVGPQEVHDRWDDIGEAILGKQPDDRYRDLMGAGANTLRTRVLLGEADRVIAYCGEADRQGNAETDAGQAGGAGAPRLPGRGEGRI